MAEDSRPPAPPATERLAELRETYLRLHATIRERLRELGAAEQHIVDRVLKGEMSMDIQRVDGYKLADGMLARSMRLNVRLNQRSLMYFNIRRRLLRRTLTSLGLDPNALEQEWLASMAVPDSTAADQTPEAPPDPASAA